MGEKVNVEALRALRVIECKNGQPWNKAGTKKKRAPSAASPGDGTASLTQKEAEARSGGATTMEKQPKKKRQPKRENTEPGSKAKRKNTKRPRTGKRMELIFQIIMPTSCGSSDWVTCRSVSLMWSKHT